MNVMALRAAKGWLGWGFAERNGTACHCEVVGLGFWLALRHGVPLCWVGFLVSITARAAK